MNRLRFTFYVSRFTNILGYLLPLSILIFLAVQPLLTTDFTCGYDNVFHMWRAVQVGNCLRQGYLYPRFAPDMAHGYGFLLFNFVSPGSAYVAAALNLLGLSWPLAVNGTFVLGVALGGYFILVLARDLFGPAAGLVAAAAYLFAPFQAYDVFNRGGLSESFAWAFPPLVLWAVHRWSLHGRRRFLLLATLSLAGFILTHNLFAFLFSPLLVSWVLLEGYLARDWRVIGRGALAGLLGLGLCTFFWLPGLAERGWVQTGRLLGTWVFDYRNNFLDLRQLLALPRSVDPALINDWPPKALGLLPVLVALLPLARWRRLSRPTRCRVALLLALIAGFAFLTLSISRPLWDHLPLLHYAQFPWRFLGPAAFCIAILAGATLCPPRATHHTSRFTFHVLRFTPAVVVAILLLSNLGWFYPDHCSPPGDTSVAGMIAWERATHTLGATAKGEYLPIWVRQMPSEISPALDAAYADGGPIARLSPESLPEGARILRAEYGPVDATIELESRVSFQAQYLAFYYPGWRVAIDGHPVTVSPTEPDGLISFDVPPGRHLIRVRFGETGLRFTADILSALSLIVLLALVTRPSRFLSRLTFHVSRFTFHELVITLVTVLFLAALALNLSPYLRGPDDWRWAYAIPGRFDRLWIPALALSLYLALACAWVGQATRSESSRWRRRILLLGLVLTVPIIQASLLGGDFLRPLFYRTVSVGSGGVFSVGTIIDDPGDFLRGYPALMPTLPVHSLAYPPGQPLLFYLIRRLLEQAPSLADGLGFRLRLYQCHDLPLMRLSNATIGSAVVQMALPLVSGLALLPLYGLARRAYGRRAAAWAVALYPLVPSFALWSGRWEQLYPFLTSLCWYLLYVGLTRARRSVLLVAGFVLSVASLLNFSMLALLLPMGLFALLWLLKRPARYRRGWGKLGGDAFAFLVGLASLWGVYQLALGVGFLDIWRVSMSYHLGLGRDYGTWLIYNLYDFFIFLGLPLALLFLIALAKALIALFRSVTRRHPRISVDALTLGFGLGLLLLDLSGTSRGEIARLWLFLTPFAVLVAVRGLMRLRLGQRGFVLVACLLALQLFTFNTFLRVVTTGLTDPPSRARVFEPPPSAHPLDARFSVNGADAVALLGYDLEPESPAPGDTLHLTLYWQSLQPLARPYNVFTHLVDSEGRLVGQQDNMPLRDTAPTTCWLPGEIIADPYDISVDRQAVAGDYVLETGFYFWRTGERLPVSGAAAASDRRVVLPPVSIGDR